jgi:hydroxymethylpyrimidine pyrophosphatase-like HAD family hydrolase
VPEDGRTVFDVIEASGAPALLLDRFALEYHAPWHEDRDVSHLFRGMADAAEVDALLEAEGHGALRLVDNGAIVAPMPGIPRPHAYHLIPRAASKARAVAFHMRARGFAPEECIAVGDSQEDLGAAEAVGTFWLVANGAADTTGVANVRRCEGANGAGVYEAVLTELAERR